ncbi:uncharacterized protein A4U43_C03F3880 [Asparagus officinalis]|uniref:Ribonuclease H2 subunit B n=1 Tax=Asparagus officinalis TaxID=4686 RepID=A0A5P1F741_ASPOF|nr:ribonuclease H2 subunit B isoform X1 [Asparagus officinalis]XP_020255896.1 ribonuclease H2 subunit B isoform X2 [Asparagus officinalis]ONK74205.1 uncharacterized protein A4U43_C03F3880 [Asparagus officinalis]
MTSKIYISKVESINDGDDKTAAANVENIISLRHPKSDASASYAFKNGLLQELHWFKQSYGSWFLGDYVCEDGSLYISTPVDPIFILLPIFADARMKRGTDLGVFRQLDEILYIEGYPGYRRLMSMAEDSMHLVCEVKEVGSSKFFRLDDSKVLSWLCCKVVHLKASLAKLDKNYAIQDERETLKEIVSILGEYLKDEPWLTLLCSHLKLNWQEALQNTPRNEKEPGFLEDTPMPSRPLSGKVDTAKKKSSNAKQTKKLKAETDSQNIKNMFQRVTRRRS